jgi:hypothetical protein
MLLPNNLDNIGIATTDGTKADKFDSQIQVAALIKEKFINEMNSNIA